MMKKMLKIFVGLLLAFDTTKVCADGGVRGAMQAARAKETSVFVTVTDAKKKPIPGLVIKTINNNLKLSATTNAQGVAQFEDFCNLSAKLGFAYSHEKRAKGQTNRRPVRLKISDPNNKYRDVTLWLQWDEYANVGSCNVSVKLSDDTIRSSFPSANQLQYAFDSRTGNLKFYDICTSDVKPGGKIQSGCIDVFKNVDTQYREAKYLINEYMSNYVIPENDYQNILMECSSKIRHKGNQDFISCTSLGGKYAYDFEFDDLTESRDQDLVRDTSKALCEIIYQGKFYSGATAKYCRKNSPDETKKMCGLITGSTHDLSWTAKYYESFAVGYNNTYQGEAVSSTPRYEKDICVFNFRDAGRTYTPKTFEGIDNTKYEYIQIRSLPSLEFLLHQYVQANIPYKLDSFRCTNGFRQWDSPNGTKHLFECWATANDQEHTIEFIFDDINVSTELVSNAGESGMFCIANGGSFDGSKCHGLTEQQCNSLNTGSNPIPGGAKWDKNLNQCVLNDAKKLADAQNFVNAAKTSVLMTAGVVGAGLVIVATGGTGAPFVIAVIATVASVGGKTAAWIIEGNIASDIHTFESSYALCVEAQDKHKCATELLANFFGMMEVYVTSGKAEQIFTGQHAKALDEILQSTLEMVDYNRLTLENVKEYHTQLKKAKQRIRNMNIAQNVSWAGDLALIIVGGVVSLSSTSTRAATVATRVQAGRISSAVTKIEKVMSKISDLSTQLNEICRVSNANSTLCPI